MEHYLVVYDEAMFYDYALARLQKKVEQLYKEGWKPQGGVCVLHDDNWKACQAMIK